MNGHLIVTSRSLATSPSSSLAVVRNIEGHLERQRRLQDRESTAQLTATLDKMRVVLEQVRDSISTDTKTELRKVTSEFPERVRCLLAPMIQAEMQNVAKDQKVALDGALLAVQVPILYYLSIEMYLFSFRMLFESTTTASCSSDVARRHPDCCPQSPTGAAEPVEADD